ncbi:adenylate/guanylate cyclase domain-containing protein [Niveibacterium umoris]|uniref:Class 3 adenylate cyclase n=1 Tax=Niveibacterium umoris TaxID=1193620 RepID=A0A840BQE3_9RHOO|nr:adenylate/guanylate cyclase domain-containing protein [Niveibacterium umoris]MBB4013748.1 class 3 adenylate cyclase [Niveibacterium umoris]
MSNRNDMNCVLFAELLGDTKVADKLGSAEAQRALDRARNRIMRAVDGNHGRALLDRAHRVIAAFKRADDAVQSAAEMQEKVRRLPPVSGINLELKIGLHCGELRLGEEPAGEAVELASRLAGAASPGQTLLTGELALHLTDGVRALATAVPGRGLHYGEVEVPLYELGDGDIVSPAANGPMSEGGPSPTRSRLVLRHRGIAHIVTESRPILLMGREEGNDIVVLDRRASRHHARIEWRGGRFYIVDQSSNGTFVAPEDEAEIMLKREECALPANGRVGCGFSCDEDTQGELVTFEVREA